MDPESREVLTIQNCSLQQSFAEIKEIVERKKAKIYFDTQWCDVFDGEKFIKPDVKKRKRVYCEDF